MTLTKLLGLSAFSLVVAAFVGGTWGKHQYQEYRPRFVKGDFGEGPVPQSVHRRSWKRMPSTRIWTINALNSLGLKGPLNCEIAPWGELFVVDYGSPSVTVVSPDGELVHQLLGFLGISDIAFIENRVLVADRQQAGLFIFDRSGRMLGVSPLDSAAYGMAPSSLSNFFFILLPTSQFAFAHASRGGELRSFGRLLVNQKVTGLALNGMIETDGEGGFVYASRYGGLLARVRPNGVPDYLRSTIDPVALPVVFKETGGLLRVSSEADLSAIGLSTSRHTIYISTMKREGLIRLGVIDAYAIEKGEYLHSIRVPEPSRQALVWRDNIFTIGESRISKWR